MAQAGQITLTNEGTSPALVMLLTVCVLALPGAILAYSGRLEGTLPGIGTNQGLGALSGSGVDPHMTRALAVRPDSIGPLFRFTPAGLTNRPDRSVTVAVRVDEQTAHSIVVRGLANRPLPYAAPGSQTLHIASTAYNLGLAHGYQGFTATPTPTTFTLPRDSKRSEMPDITAYGAASTDNSAAATVSRLAPRVQLEDKERAGRAPRTLEAVGEQSLDVGGSYRVSRNFDVTAGVRYSQDRDRLKSVAPDSQAVYVGTQFRF
ncbi:MAG: hypothetical protein KGJ57_13035 [Sphingomonadales bacterium]|nr:hypothetical protein [Sphingomonadales bacterium]MDE2170337.1 hypothetical protein [Sphingomonadales bacterium]